MAMIYEFNDKQLDRLSEFLSNLSLVVVASLIIPNLIGKVDKADTNTLILGLITALVTFLLSLIIIKEK